MKSAMTLIVNPLLRCLDGSRVKSTRVSTLVFACGVAFTGNLAQPEAAQAQLQCLICNQLTGYENGEWVWIHWFDMDSGEVCEVDPGPMCRWCGDESTCHEGPVDDDGDGIPDRVDTDEGQCHSQGCMPEFVLMDLAGEVTTLVASLDSRTGPLLAARVASEPSLMYDAPRNVVRLIRCEGTVMREWYLDELVQNYLVDYDAIGGQVRGYRAVS